MAGSCGVRHGHRQRSAICILTQRTRVRTIHNGGDILSIYRRLSQARLDFRAAGIKKTGRNDFAKFSYYELEDILPKGLEVMAKHGLTPVVSCPGDGDAVMTIYDDQSDRTIIIAAPKGEVMLKACHNIQNVGARITYSRRYLWMTALEIADADMAEKIPPASKKKQTRSIDELRTRIRTLVAEAGGTKEVGPAVEAAVKKNVGEWAKISDCRSADKLKAILTAFQA